MRRSVDVAGVLCTIAAIACSGSTSDTTKPVTAGGGPPAQVRDADPGAVHVPSPIPTGDIRITYACSHTAKPFGTTHWSQTTVFDLATGRATVDRAEADDDDPDKTQNIHTETIVPAERLAAIRVSLDKLVHGGPYHPEHPVPEGMVCTLSLWVPGEPPFFTIDKAGTAQPDAVSQLVKDLGN